MPGNTRAEEVAMLAWKRQAVPQQQEEDQPAQRHDSRAITVAGLTLIAIQLIWTTALLTHSYFRQDDFSYLYRGLESGFGWRYLTFEDAGQLMPFGMSVFWVLARISLYDWALASIVTLALVAGTSLAMLRMLRTLFGNRPAILALLALFLFSPLQLAGISWWSWGLIILPVELATCMAVDAHVRYLRGGRRRNAIAAAGWMLLGMAASDKGAVVPLLLFGLTLAFFADGPGAAAGVRAAVRHWRVWLLYGVVLAAWAAVYVAGLASTNIRPSAPSSASSVLVFMSTLAGSVLSPAAIGGPWRWSSAGYSIVSPPAALQQLSWAVCAIVVVVSCIRRERAWRGWAILAGWIAAADILPVVVGRLGQIPVSLLAMQARYLEDAAPVLALCTGLAFLPLAGEQSAARFRLPAARPVTSLTVGACLVGSFWSLQAFEWQNNTTAATARSYIATARAAVAGAPPGTLIVDGPTPTAVMAPLIFGPYGSTSQVIGAIARGEPAKHLLWTPTPSGEPGNLMIFNSQGQLLPATVDGAVSWPPPPGKNCWSVTSARLRIPLNSSPFRWQWTARVDYSGPSSVLAVSYGGNWSETAVPGGTHVAYIPVLGQGNEFSVRLAHPGPKLCITSVTVGSLHPAPSGPAIPATPVAG